MSPTSLKHVGEYAAETFEELVGLPNVAAVLAMMEAKFATCRREAIEVAAKHLDEQAKKWITVAEQNQHRTDAPSRAVAIELSCQADIIRGIP